MMYNIEFQLFVVILFIACNRTEQRRRSDYEDSGDNILIANKRDIREHQPLTLTCNAQVVNLHYSFQEITKLSLQRYFKDTPAEIIATYEPDTALSSNRQIFKIPTGRDWKVSWTEVTFNEVSTRKRSIQVNFKVAGCDDAAVYECVVFYRNASGAVGEKRGRQVLTARAAVTDLQILVVPPTDFYHIKGDDIVLICTVNGPQDLRLTWQRIDDNDYGTDSLPQYGRLEKEGWEQKLDNCSSKTHESVLHVHITWEGTMFFHCIADYFTEPPQQYATYIAIHSVEPSPKPHVVMLPLNLAGRTKEFVWRHLVIVLVLGVPLVIVLIAAIHFMRRCRLYQKKLEKAERKRQEEDAETDALIVEPRSGARHRVVNRGDQGQPEATRRDQDQPGGRLRTGGRSGTYPVPTDSPFDIRQQSTGSDLDNSGSSQGMYMTPLDRQSYNEAAGFTSHIQGRNFGAGEQPNPYGSATGQGRNVYNI